MKGANFLEKLLDDQPVEWKKLGEVATFYGGLTGKSKEDFNKGNAYYISYKNIYENIAVDATCLERVNVGEGERQHTVKYGDVLITGSSENLEEAGMSSSVTFESETNIYLNSFSFGIRFNEGIELSPEFTKYLFRTNMMRKQIMSTAQGVTRFNVSKKRFATIEIPIPPLSVQSRIVEILDKFTSLEAELDCRKRQYIYYRERLLDFSQNKNIQWKKLGEVFITRNGYTPSKSNPEYWEGGTIPWYRMEDIRENGRILSDALQHITPKGVKGNRLFKADSIILATSATIGEHALITTKALANQRFTNFEIKEDFKEKLLPKFVFYYFYVIDDWCKNHIDIGNFPSVDVEQVKKMDFPLPPLSEQQRIVEILDKFDTLTNSISEGLPLEIQLRRQQYEYYREQLLAFPHP